MNKCPISCELKLIPYWLYELGEKDQIIDPKGMGRETADTIFGRTCFTAFPRGYVGREKAKEILKPYLERAQEESKKDYLKEQHKTYYHALIKELEDYSEGHL